MPKNHEKQALLGRVMFVFINVLVWVIILCFPFLVATREGSLVGIDKYVIYSWIPLMFMLVFYFNYYFLIDKLVFEQRRWLVFWLCNGVMIVVVASCSHLLQEFYLTRIVGVAPPSEKIALASYIIRDGLVLMLVIGLSVALKMVAAWQTQERERARLEAEKRDAELQNLRSQLNPHFLFNTLNNIYALVASDGERAREAIHSLSTLLRYTLYARDERVSLAEEMDFVHNFVELARLRHGAGVAINVSLPSDTKGLTIAPLMFMTLIENGFKHGVSSTGEASFVRVVIEISNVSGQGIVRCLVQNSDYPKQGVDRSGSGIGLDNLRRRLTLLYPKTHSLTLERRDGVHTAELIITL